MTPHTTKRCSKCGETKTVAAFYPHDGKPDGVNAWCITCSKAYAQAIHAANRAAKHLPGKVCGSCGETKPLTDFYRNRSKADGYGTECKACKKAYASRSDVKARDAQRKTVVRRQSLFRIELRREPERREPEYAPYDWRKILDPEKREVARREYEDLLRPPPVVVNGRRIGF